MMCHPVHLTQHVACISHALGAWRSLSEAHREEREPHRAEVAREKRPHREHLHAAAQRARRRAGGRLVARLPRVHRCCGQVHKEQRLVIIHCRTEKQGLTKVRFHSCANSASSQRRPRGIMQPVACRSRTCDKP